MATTSQPSESEAATLGRRYVEEFMNTGDAAVAEELLDDDVVVHQLGVDTDRTGREAVVEHIRAFREAVPDWRLDIEDSVASEERAMLRMTARGTPERPWGKLVPTGRSFEVDAFFAFRVADGKIVELWTLANLAAIGRQLGLLPPRPAVLPKLVAHRLRSRLGR